MSLDVSLYAMRRTSVFDANITHNLAPMAWQADLYEALWRPEKLGVVRAEELVPLLQAGLERLHADKGRLLAFEPANGFGTYADLVAFVERYLEACLENPDAEVVACP